MFMALCMYVCGDTMRACLSLTLVDALASDWKMM
jgi:hypothetical protein